MASVSRTKALGRASRRSPSAPPAPVDASRCLFGRRVDDAQLSVCYICGAPKFASATLETCDQSFRSEIQALLGSRFEVLEFDAGTRTAEDAATAIGCKVAQIAKSLVFRAASGRPVLVVASGVHRVDEKTISALVGEPIARADADFVREATGFAIGGVPPVGHRMAPVALIDESLMAFEKSGPPPGRRTPFFA